jgi:hypothetical protein
VEASSEIKPENMKLDLSEIKKDSIDINQANPKSEENKVEQLQDGGD